MNRRTKIVCTLGPATDSAEGVRELVESGMDVARLNFSHGTHADHQAMYERVRAASDVTGRAVGILADLQGPKIRLGSRPGATSTTCGGTDMRVIHEMPTYILEADIRHDEIQDIHTLDLYQTWPTMAKPYRRRVAQLNLPHTALVRLAEFISENANGPA